MGNEEAIPKNRANNNRRRSLPTSSFDEVSAAPSHRRDYNTINQSL